MVKYYNNFNLNSKTKYHCDTRQTPIEEKVPKNVETISKDMECFPMLYMIIQKDCSML